MPGVKEMIQASEDLRRASENLERETEDLRQATDDMRRVTETLKPGLGGLRRVAMCLTECVVEELTTTLEILLALQTVVSGPQDQVPGDRQENLLDLLNKTGWWFSWQELHKSESSVLF